MAYFNSTKIKTIPQPIPDIPPYVPPTPPTPPQADDGSVPSVPRGTFTGVANITLYSITDDNNVVNKSLGSGISFDIDFKNDTSIIKPSIVLSTTTDLSNINYMYIDIVNRYYYVDEIILLNGNLFRLNCHVDVLMSFRNAIKGIDGIVKKTEDTRYTNNDIDDGSFVNQEGYWIEFKHYLNGFSDTPCYILTACGGSGVSTNG